MYTANTQPRSPVSPDSWYQSHESHHYPTQAEAAWPSQTLQSSPMGDIQATHYYSGLPTTTSHSNHFSPMSDSTPSVSTSAQRQDVHDYQYQHQSPLTYHYDGQYSLPTPPNSSEYVSAEIAQHYHTIPGTLENQHHTLGEHRRSRPGEHQQLLAQRDLYRRPTNQVPLLEVIIQSSFSFLVRCHIPCIGFSGDAN